MVLTVDQKEALKALAIVSGIALGTWGISKVVAAPAAGARLKSKVGYFDAVGNPALEFYPGDSITIKVAVTNIGDVEAENVKVSMTVYEWDVGTSIWYGWIGAAANISAGATHIFTDTTIIPLDTGFGDISALGYVTCDNAPQVEIPQVNNPFIILSLVTELVVGTPIYS